MIFKCLKFERRGTFLGFLSLEDSNTYCFFGFLDDKPNFWLIEISENAFFCPLTAPRLNYPQVYPQVINRE